MAKDAMIFLSFVMIAFGFCNCSVYKVGDSAGWTVNGNMDYNKWASPKSFQVGDTFVFMYNPSFHNVVRVTRSNFHSCNATSPITVYTSGNDSIIINNSGHYYYICGFAGHCQAGQKVDLRVPKSGQAEVSPVSSPIKPHNETLAPDASSYGPMAPGPSHSSGQSIMYWNGLLSLKFGLFCFLVWAF